ncbi:MAG: para-aminobenzoate synthetase / 4-amino-4-deoxychorismate lyase [Burkholderiales bacterium]
MNTSHDVTNCFALLDDNAATESDRRSRLYTGHAGTLSCAHASELPALWEQLQKALQEGKHAVGLFSYELGAGLHDVAERSGNPGASQVLFFDRCEQLSATEVESWLSAQSIPASGIANIRTSVGEEQFVEAIERIHAYIEAGDTYQVNYTYRLRFDAYGSPLGLYTKLRARQPVPYGALITLPEGGAVLSLSPELFVQHTQGELTARPMKGTAAATGDAAQDAERAAQLAADPKNRAENLMIVDLLRNDLGRIAASGSVTVPHLFDVDRYNSVLQMTSTVRARLRDDVTLAQAFAALYPCGSITGAPKRRTMQIIRELEPDSRGIYTGAIGWFDETSSSRIGDFCLSVPIRTLVLGAPGPDGVRAGEMGVGAGIVHDSVAAEEYAECKLKAKFLTGLESDFEIFETMYATRDEGCRHVELHLQRLRSSAAYFGYAFNDVEMRGMLERTCAGLSPGPHRVRLALKQSGVCVVQSAQLIPLPGPVSVLIAPQPTLSTDLFLRHKTTVRERYDRAWRAAEAQGAFDMLFFNTDGELTEGARSNVFIKLDGRWYTPPLAAGLLPGVMRSVLLDDPAWNATERRLTLEDLRAAEEVVVCNALRGAVRATVQF